MRLFETLAIFILVAYLPWHPPRPILVRLLPLFALASLLAHLALEGLRWQMIPVYVIALVVAAVAFLGRSGEVGLIPARAILGLLAVSAALPVLLPVPNIPPPGGQHAVGTSIFSITDESRRELYSGRDEPRRFMVQVWYPAEPGGTETAAPWMDRADVYGPAISEFLEMPPFFLDHLALAKTPALQNAPLSPSSSGYPIILFSHGWNGFGAQNSGQVIELASHGFVVVALHHPYGAITTAFPDGTIAPNNPDALPEGAAEEVYDEAARTLAAQWSGDIAAALDFIIAQNQISTSPFYTALDPQRVGIYGHSTGGGAAIQFCGTDERCDAVLAMDPFMTPVSPDVLNGGVPQPAFFMFSQAWADDEGSKNNRLFADFGGHLPASLGVIRIEGTRHHDFSDLPLLSPIAPQLGLKGPIRAARMSEIAEGYLLAFFNLTLKGGSPDAFTSLGAQFPEVTSIR